MDARSVDARRSDVKRTAEARMGARRGLATLGPAMPEDPDEIPLFPLPNVVLFPLARVPLFVFEPRYRQMTTDALEARPRRIGMVAVPEPDQDAMAGDPPVARIGCEGEIVGAEKGDDGTFRILLKGTRRFRIVDERGPEGERLYRLARVETLQDLIDDADRLALHAARDEILTLLADLVRRTVPQHADAFRSDRFDGVDDEQLVNTLAQAIDLDVHDKQQLLELDHVRERQRVLCDLMRFRIAELDGGGSHGPSTVQ